MVRVASKCRAGVSAKLCSASVSVPRVFITRAVGVRSYARVLFDTCVTCHTLTSRTLCLHTTHTPIHAAHVLCGVHTRVSRAHTCTFYVLCVMSTHRTTVHVCCAFMHMHTCYLHRGTMHTPHVHYACSVCTLPAVCAWCMYHVQ